MQEAQDSLHTQEKNYDIWLKYSSSYSAIILPDIYLENYLSKIFSIVYSLSYQSRYSLTLEIFFEDLKSVNLNTIDNFLRNLYNFATPLLEENAHFEFIILVPQLTNTSTLISKESTLNLEVIFENETFQLTESPYHKNINTTCLKQSLTLVPNNLKAEDYYMKLTPSSSNKEIKAYKRACLGGTYDHIHAGHRLFLSFACLTTKNYLLCGLTSDEMLSKKSHKSAMQCFETRYNSVLRFLQYFDPTLKVDVVELKDPAGPAKDGDFEIVVVTPETLKGGTYINALRREGGFKELEVVVGNLVSNTGEVQDKLSSTNIRETVMKKVDGKIEVLEELYNEWIQLMQELGVSDACFVGKWFDRIKEKYSESWRYYHTLTHVWSLLKMCNENVEDMQEKDVVKLAAWFHDVIYVPQKPDNEKESVRFFEEFVAELNERLGDKHRLEQEKQERVKKIIIYTINHSQVAPEAKDWFDAKFFLDIDLGVLGSDEDVYSKYAEDIRKEYCFVAETVFREKRAQFMQRFLNKELEIYKTDLIKNKMEEKALKNVQAEVDRLLGNE